MHDIRAFIPEPFERPGDLLYVGYRPDACAWLQELHDAGNEIAVLEIWPRNVTGAVLVDRRVTRWWIGDVREADRLDGLFDYVWWWHGPEHVDRAEFPGVLAKLAAKCRGLVAVAAPWGRYDQGPHDGNPHERHRWSVGEEDLLMQGMIVKADGARDQPGSEIVGVLR